jgi:hypothetical protein
LRDSAATPVGARAAWIAAIAMSLAVLAWPVLAGMVVTNDDLKFVRAGALDVGIVPEIARQWRESATFRPLEVLVGATCDPVTLAVGLTLPVQGLGLLVLALALRSLARRVAPGLPAAAPLALLLVLLSPGTTNALWQMDACSQTWSAALGTVALALAWRAADAARAGTVDGRALVALGAVFLLGCCVKETFYGWSASIGTAVIVLAAFRWRRDRAAAAPTALILIPAAVIPAAHFLLRWTTGALGGAASAGTGERYTAELGTNVIVNAAMGVAGTVANGPFHAVMDGDAPVVVRVLPLLSVLVLGGLLIVAAGFAWMHRRDARESSMVPAAVVAAIGLGSMVVVLPMGSVSELYCFGANVGMAVLLAVAACELWSSPAESDRAMGRSVAGACIGIAVAVGAFGLAGRAYHHRISWACARFLNEELLRHVATVPAVDPASGRAAAVVYLGTSCILGRTYGQYVMPPAQALGVESTGPWLRRRDPSRPVAFTLDPPPGSRAPIDLVLDCGSLPQRAHW